jgi:hypothetical protein
VPKLHKISTNSPYLCHHRCIDLGHDCSCSELAALFMTMQTTARLDCNVVFRRESAALEPQISELNLE